MKGRVGEEEVEYNGCCCCDGGGSGGVGGERGKGQAS